MRSLNPLGFELTMVKLSIGRECARWVARLLIADGLGCDTGMFVLGLLPENSASLT